MEEEPVLDTQATIDRVLELEEELEASGFAASEGNELEKARVMLHKWIDDLVAVVVSPGLGRVTVIHPNGRQSSIASADLPFIMSSRVGKHPDEKE